jgi:hypothetical protein
MGENRTKERESAMTRKNAFAITLAAALLTAAGAQAAPTRDDIQAPRWEDQQAPHNEDVQAPRGQDVQAPRNEDVQAPRG